MTNVRVDPAWSDLLTEAGARAADVLRMADLPEDLLSRPRAVLEPDQHIRLWAAIAASLGPLPTLTIGQMARVDDPALMAVLCSRDLATGLERMAVCNGLTGRMQLAVSNTLGGLEARISARKNAPRDMILAGLVSIVEMARRGLRDELRPVAVEMKKPPDEPEYRAFFGRTLRSGPFDRVVFTSELAKRRFPPPPPTVFQHLEADLQPRLDQLDPQASMADRLRAVLTEALPGGQADAAEAARRLGMSTRSLQRRLLAESTSFKAELKCLRTGLAQHYLTRTVLSGAEIGFLLGYDDPNSFIRAFHDWTGTTPEALRRTVTKG